MYLHQELRLVADYRQTEALKRIHWLHSLMSLQPGFVRTLACRNPGRIDHYLWLRFWTSPEGNTDFRKTEEARQFAASRPEGMLYEPLPGGIAGEGHWHSVVEPRGKELGNYLVRIAFDVPDGRVDEFIEDRRRYSEVALETPGVISTVTLACNEAGSTHYLTFLRAIDREAFNNLLESAQLARLRGAEPSGFYRTLTTECYEILDEIAPAEARREIGEPGRMASL
jgi:hypothetical protein